MPKDRNYDSVFLELFNIRCNEKKKISNRRWMNAYYSVTRMLKTQWTN